MNDGAPATLRVAVLGCGVVGTEVVRGLLGNAAELRSRTGTQLDLVGIGVRSLSTTRDPVVPVDLLTDDLTGLVRRADLVIELMGGIEPARGLILDSLAAGASVITANKALLAQHGPALHEAADSARVDLFYEAAVAGAVPIVRGVRESLAGDTITRVLGIVNGTTNYILDEMTTNGLDFGTALAQAQELGYAEADPTADVEGFDAAAKATILASLAFHSRTSMDDVPVQGITSITSDDIASAAQTGHVIKMLVIAEQGEHEGVAGLAVRVHPALVPTTHPLASVRGPYNAVFVEAEAAGTLMFYGAGAGGAATSSAVLGDVVAAARDRVNGGKAPSESAHAALPAMPAQAVHTRYQMRLDVLDVPGVLAEIAAAVAAHGVSIETVRQGVRDPEDGAALVIVTHSASESALAATVADLDTLDVVERITSILRVEGN
ncbi:homoserine dehydrogenase [Ruania halotolerans]|uniref:homoserine dehydrogenase n=1 Tax=Ruania halotolerans TaxID=2897773 RepID=UPI001E58B98C|nr:homoserine dehydrogenase [Ruania halotolerans]UFU07641.1 homoserine dehydrogenase [Ruania halotolerans]